MYKYKINPNKIPLGLQDFYTLNENDLPHINKISSYSSDSPIL